MRVSIYKKMWVYLHDCQSKPADDDQAGTTVPVITTIITTITIIMITIIITIISIIIESIVHSFAISGSCIWLVV